MLLPSDRQMLSGRTHSRPWCPAEAGAAIEGPSRGRRGLRRSSWDTPAVGAAIVRFRRRAALVDVVCWVASGLLVLGSLALAFV